MIKSYHDPELGSILKLSDEYEPIDQQDNGDFFKIIWNRSAPVDLYIDSWKVTLEKDQMICLTPLQDPCFAGPPQSHYRLLFNREFYCIHENDHEVSCEGLLFWGSSEVPIVTLDEEERPKFEALFKVFIDELEMKDNIQGEMLRMLLKRLIIKGTRLARKQHYPNGLDSAKKELIRRFNVLVEKHFREYHQVNAYAEMLHKSPKTLSNVFAAAGNHTPLEVIHNRIALEAKRLLLKTDNIAKTIGYELGFEEPSHFSRFFKKRPDYPHPNTEMQIKSR